MKNVPDFYTHTHFLPEVADGSNGTLRAHFLEFQKQWLKTSRKLGKI